ncbi:MAG TPA: hypothetical protein DDW67_06275 [Elusimicrobia bacterium]|nr:hypothetical protein [Elusimicrobiota bacterium]
MKRRILGGSIAFALLAVAAGARAEAPVKKTELVEKTGVIEIIKADAAKNEKFDTILLKSGEEAIKLLPGKDKKAFKPLEKMAGKTVTVKGEFLPPNPPKYPLAAIKVSACAEVKEAKKPAAKPAKK